ncbi:MAG: bifunctional folylpolyglutamate synthase/dihydrofolate synthase [Alphaproteobacteria bacterium]|nr:bifunctional folylpolyglutamate synthase/dihydrofolate synthase [Alphaproteobacteria bacterium]
MPPRSDDILQRLSAYHAVNIDLSLRDSYSQLLEKLGNPHLELPPVIHVAGTNGKGSTIAFMRAMLEAAGLKVHVYTSPHLVSFHERIRLAGNLISESSLCSVLLECEYVNEKAPVTLFEITTAAAFLAFSRIPADVLLLETGLGGRLDATNVVPHPIASVITRISYDHRDFLGDTLEQIAGEKAGIFKANVPAIIAPQFSDAVSKSLAKKATETHTPCFTNGSDWSYAITENGFEFRDNDLKLTLPKPKLIGEHQYANAATAVATLKKQTQFKISDEAIRQGVETAAWPARLQRLSEGPLVQLLPAGSELWLDGGHNDSAGEALAQQAKHWATEDGNPLLVMMGMLNTKNVAEFLGPLAPHIGALAAIPIPDEPKSMTGDAITQTALELGISASTAHHNAQDGLGWLLGQTAATARILITGSLYLAGQILKSHR